MNGKAHEQPGTREKGNLGFDSTLAKVSSVDEAEMEACDDKTDTVQVPRGSKAAVTDDEDDTASFLLSCRRQQLRRPAREARQTGEAVMSATLTRWIRVRLAGLLA